jgi:hypothetical protein
MNRRTLLACAAVAAFVQPVAAREGAAQALTAIDAAGISIDDQAAIFARLADRPYAEYRAVDPEGNWFDLSEHGYVEAETAAVRRNNAL